MNNNINKFWQSATGHAIIGALVTALGSILTALVSSPAATTLLRGGAVTVVLKYVVDLLRPDLTNV